MKWTMGRRMLAAAAMMMLFASCALAQGAEIDNGSDPLSLLNLRAAPDKGAQVIGKFRSGTEVSVLGDAGGGFSQVEIGSGAGTVCGYVMTQYLSDAARIDATQEARVASPYGTQSVILRDQPSNSYHPVAMLMVGDSVLVIGEMDGFCFVLAENGCVGCLTQGELE